MYPGPPSRGPSAQMWVVHPEPASPEYTPGQFSVATCSKLVWEPGRAACFVFSQRWQPLPRTGACHILKAAIGNDGILHAATSWSICQGVPDAPSLLRGLGSDTKPPSFEAGARSFRPVPHVERRPNDRESDFLAIHGHPCCSSSSQRPWGLSGQPWLKIHPSENPSGLVNLLKNPLGGPRYRALRREPIFGV